MIVTITTMNLGGLAMPQTAQAVTTQTISQAGGCITGGLLSSWLSGVIDSGLKALQDKIKEMASKWVRSLLGSLVEGLLSASVPTSAKDQSLLSYLQNHDYRDAVIARCLARQMLDNIGQNTATIIKTRGRDGGTSLVPNWTNFITKAQYRGENIFRAELSTTKLCAYLSDDIKKAYGVDPKKKTPLTGQNTRIDSLLPFSLQAGCTLPAGFSMDSYNQDFGANGGWDTFARLLEPQNNSLGLTAIANDEIARQRALQVTSDLNQAVAGQGYTGISGKGKDDSCRVKSPTGECLVYKDIKTTGSYLAATEAADIGAQYSWLTSAQGLNTIIEDLTQNMINRLFDQSDTSGKTISNPGYTVSPPPDEGVPPPPDALTKHPSQVQAVIAAIVSLTSKNVDLSGPCGAFIITDTAAWSLKDSGAGILSKPGGNNCMGYAVDIIAFPDGYIYDVLGDAGGANTPAWNPDSCGDTATCSDRYRPAIDPSTIPTTTPTPQ
jgi:hypothetical protein